MIIKDILSAHLPFYNKLTEREKSQLNDNSKIIKYSKGQNVYSANNDCLGVIIILKGELRAYMLSEEGREVTLYRLKDNDCCIMSASCLLKNITFDVFVDSMTETEILLISSTVFEKLQKDNTLIENFALKVAVTRFSDVMWSFEQMLFYKLEKRLALFIVDEINAAHSLTVNLTHEQIAKYIGSAREVVSRALKNFEKQGILTVTNGKIVIHDKDKLNKVADIQ